MNDPLARAAAIVAEGGSCAIVTVIEGEGRWAKYVVDDSGIPVGGEPDAPGPSPAELQAMIGTLSTGTVEADGRRFFVEVLGPPPRLLLFGGGPIGEALCAIAARAGFAVHVFDPREVYADPGRFPDAVQVEWGWPEDLLDGLTLDARTFVVSLLHERRFEKGLLPRVLGAPVRYVGALGSSRTHAARAEWLRDEGVPDGDIARVHGPVGLGIGAVTPEEIAVSIVAEMVEALRGPARQVDRAAGR